MADVPPLRTLLENRLRELNPSGKKPLSARKAAERSGGLVSYETVRRILKGTHRGNVEERTMRGLALALDLPYTTIYRSAVGTDSAPPPPFTLPERASRLTGNQRRVVLSVIDTILTAAAADRRQPAAPPPAADPSNQTVTSGLPDSGGNIGSPDAGGRRTARPPRRSGRSAVERHLEDAREPGARRDRASDGRT